MPIKGVSEVRRITRGGHIRLGEIKKTAKGAEYPSKIDYFRADFEDPENARIFHELYGEKPKKITIAFAYETIDENFPQWYKFYGKSSGLRCKGDGERAVRMTDKNEMVDVECPTPDYCKYCAGSNGKPQCNRNASLQFFIKGIPGLNVFQINTGSFNSIVNINSSIELLRSWRNGAPISGLWLELELVPQFAQAEGKKVTIYTLRLNVKVSLHEILEQRQDWRPPAALPAPLDVYDPLLDLEPDPFVTAAQEDDEYAPEPEPEPEPANPAAEWLNDDDVREILDAIDGKIVATMTEYAFKKKLKKAAFMALLKTRGYIPEPEEEPEPEPAPAPAPKPKPTTAPVTTTAPGVKHPDDSF